MERNIPQVWDIFATSPGARRRNLGKDREDLKLLEQEKNPGSDSAVSLGSSDDDEDSERNISKYFDYLDDDDEERLFNAKAKRPSKAASSSSKETLSKMEEPKFPEDKSKTAKTKEIAKPEIEKDIKHIERHLSMKKTIRKKMMRDLQQAFVEDPGELQQDPARIPPEKKSNIDLHNLTISKRRMSKSEHSFLDMLKGNEVKDKKDRKGQTTDDCKIPPTRITVKRDCADDAPDNDSGNDSPTRNKFRNQRARAPCDPQETKLTSSTKISKEDKKVSFWKRLTGKGKNKR